MATDGWATRDLLLDVAGELIARGGSGELSLREVARRAGVSAPAVYRHFANKEALVAAVTQIGFQTLCTYLVAAMAHETPRARLDASGEAYLRFGLENPEDYRAIFMTRACVGKSDSPREAFQLLVDRVRECMDARVLERGDPETVAVAIWAHVHGLVSLRLSGHLARPANAAEFAQFYRRSVGKLVSAYEVNTVHKRRKRT